MSKNSYNKSNQYSITPLNSINTNIDVKNTQKMVCSQQIIDEKCDNNLKTTLSVINTFKNYFDTNGHTFYPSSSVVPNNDPSILFINAGMNQFKSKILGNLDNKTSLGRLKKLYNFQKCIRAGGKHNDLEDVGRDIYHHTFFIMLGNWSFGDYFKGKAIDLAWNFLVEILKINPDRLYVTYFGGDEKFPNLSPDVETREIWMKYLPEARILPFGAKDNFWEMAETGPCGCCSEIHYDKIGDRDASNLVNQDDPNVLEIWNLVFMEFNRENDISLKRLPSTCVDTGMGFERLLSIIQNKSSNYDTDIFTPIFDAIKKTLPTNTHPYTGKVGPDDIDNIDTAYRIVADHMRCLVIAISDGVYPSNEGRGYVLRRILRRAVKFAFHTLNASSSDGAWLSNLVDIVIKTLESFFPEIVQKSDIIKGVILEEELLFQKTLKKGTEKFTRIINKIRNGSEEQSKLIFPGEEAFVLFTRYGFPLDLIEIMAQEFNMMLDKDEFEKKFKEHQLISDTSKLKIFDDVGLISPEKLHFLINDLCVPFTDDSEKYFTSRFNSKFDHESFSLVSTLKAIWDGCDFINASNSGDSKKLALIFDKTIFYAEKGGQIYDRGHIFFHHTDCEDQNSSNEPARFNVLETHCVGGNYVLHIGFIARGRISVGDSSEMFIDYERRLCIMKNHTATHLLNFALRKVLGNDCDQRGSLVDEMKTRFDFSWNSALSFDQMTRIEEILSSTIQNNDGVFTREMDFKEAQKIKGLRAIFDDTYPEICRVVAVGLNLNEEMIFGANEGDDTNVGSKYSIELCSGTHVKNSSSIEDFVIVSEEGIARGIRRITAVTYNIAKKCRMNAKELAIQLESLEKRSIATRNYFNEMVMYRDDDPRINDIDDFSKSLIAFKEKIHQEKNTTPLLERKLILERLEKLQKILTDGAKIEKKLFLKMAQDLGNEMGTNHIESKYFILDLGTKFKGDLKALELFAEKFMEAIRQKGDGVRNNFCFLFTTYESDNRNLVALSYVGEESQKRGICATKWLQNSLEVLNGKSSGNSQRCVGRAKSFTLLEPFMKSSESYIKKNLSI